MKNFLLSVTAIFCMSLGAYAQESKSSTTSQGSGETAAKIIEKQFCVSVIIFTYCVTWDVVNTTTTSQSSKSVPITSGAGKIQNNGKLELLNVTGFDASMNGKMVTGKRVEVSAGKFAKAGQYLVTNSSINVPIE